MKTFNQFVSINSIQSLAESVGKQAHDLQLSPYEVLSSITDDLVSKATNPEEKYQLMTAQDEVLEGLGTWLGNQAGKVVNGVGNAVSAYNATRAQQQGTPQWQAANDPVATGLNQIINNPNVSPQMKTSLAGILKQHQASMTPGQQPVQGNAQTPPANNATTQQQPVSSPANTQRTAAQANRGRKKINTTLTPQADPNAPTQAAPGVPTGLGAGRFNQGY